MTSEQFLEQVAPMPDYNSYYYTKVPNCVNRAYFNFENYEDVYQFKEKFDNYVFLDAKGIEYHAIVEYAIYQKSPRRGRMGRWAGRRHDNKMNTYQADANFIKFVEEWNEATQAIAENKPEYCFQIKEGLYNQPILPILTEKLRILDLNHLCFNRKQKKGHSTNDSTH